MGAALHYKQLFVVLRMKMAASGRSKAKDSEKQSSLFDACKNGDLEKVKKSLTLENANSRDVAGRKSTPLHFAAGKPNRSVYRTAFRFTDRMVTN